MAAEGQNVPEDEQPGVVESEPEAVMEEENSSKVLEEINKIRKSWEIEDHWILRRDFLLIHKNRFSPERLLCMAQMFVNVETLGTGYGKEIMEQLKDLTDDIPYLEEFRKRKADLEADKQFQAPPKRKSTWNNYGGGGYNRGGYHGQGGGGGYNPRGRGGGWSNSGRGRPY